VVVVNLLLFVVLNALTEISVCQKQVERPRLTSPRVYSDYDSRTLYHPPSHDSDGPWWPVAVFFICIFGVRIIFLLIKERFESRAGVAPSHSGVDALPIRHTQEPPVILTGSDKKTVRVGAPQRTKKFIKSTKLASKPLRF